MIAPRRTPDGYRPAPDLLRDRVVLVTGAGRGIGRAAALAYARHGATVVLSGRSVPDLEAVYDEIEAAGAPQAAIVPLDLGSAEETAYAGLAAGIRETFGRLDGALLNAAILGERRPVEQTSYRSWSDVMQVNVSSQFLLCRHLLPLLRASASASLILTSSGVGRRGRAYWGAYAVSKFAVEGLVQVLADELENTSPVRVNSLNPGGTRTAMRASAYPAEDPASRPPPEALMPAYLYLMGPDSAGCNGQAFDAQG